MDSPFIVPAQVMQILVQDCSIQRGGSALLLVKPPREERTLPIVYRITINKPTLDILKNLIYITVCYYSKSVVEEGILLLERIPFTRFLI